MGFNSMADVMEDDDFGSGLCISKEAMEERVRDVLHYRTETLDDNDLNALVNMAFTYANAGADEGYKHKSIPMRKKPLMKMLKEQARTFIADFVELDGQKTMRDLKN